MAPRCNICWLFWQWTRLNEQLSLLCHKQYQLIRVKISSHLHVILHCRRPRCWSIELHRKKKAQRIRRTRNKDKTNGPKPDPNNHSYAAKITGCHRQSERKKNAQTERTKTRMDWRRITRSKNKVRRTRSKQEWEREAERRKPNRLLKRRIGKGKRWILINKKIKHENSGIIRRELETWEAKIRDNKKK